MGKINFTKLYALDPVELSDIIFTLELCRIDALKTAAELDEIFETAEIPEELRKKNSGAMRAKDLEKIITYLGGKQYVSD